MDVDNAPSIHVEESSNARKLAQPAAAKDTNPASSGNEGAGEMNDGSGRLAALGELTSRLAELGAEVKDLSKIRRKLIRELHADRYSHSRIADAAGITRGRIFQIINNPTD